MLQFLLQIQVMQERVVVHRDPPPALVGIAVVLFFLALFGWLAWLTVRAANGELKIKLAAATKPPEEKRPTRIMVCANGKAEGNTMYALSIKYPPNGQLIIENEGIVAVYAHKAWLSVMVIDEPSQTKTSDTPKKEKDEDTPRTVDNLIDDVEHGQMEGLTQ